MAGQVASIFGVNDFVTVTRQSEPVGADRGNRRGRGRRAPVARTGERTSSRPEHDMPVTAGDHAVVVGLDVGGTKTNATVLDLRAGVPGRPHGRGAQPRHWRGRPTAVEALCGGDGQRAGALTAIAPRRGARGRPGHARSGQRDGVISSKGSTNFAQPEWSGFDFARGAGGGSACRSSTTTTATPRRCTPTRSTSARMPAALVGLGDRRHRPRRRRHRSGTDRQGRGRDGRRARPRPHPDARPAREGQPLPRCNCGFFGDAESVASLTGIETQPAAVLADPVPDHQLRRAVARQGRQAGPWVRRAGRRMALKIFEQQAMALGRLFTIAANFTDPHAYFVGGGVVEAAAHFRDWFLATVREHTLLLRSRLSSRPSRSFPDLDMAGARGRRWRRCPRSDRRSPVPAGQSRRTSSTSTPHSAASASTTGSWSTRSGARRRSRAPAPPPLHDDWEAPRGSRPRPARPIGSRTDSRLARPPTAP